jgi:hypothetical protein
MSVDSRTVYENVKRSLEFIARDRGLHWHGDIHIDDLLCHIGNPHQNLGCVFITALCALRYCEWPLHVTEALALVPLNGQYTNELRDAFVAIETTLHVSSH